MVIFLDLWLTIRNPFFDREKRLKYYWALIPTLFVIYAVPLKELIAILNEPNDTDAEK
jgi:hypothetical protein